MRSERDRRPRRQRGEGLLAHQETSPGQSLPYQGCPSLCSCDLKAKKENERNEEEKQQPVVLRDWLPLQETAIRRKQLEKPVFLRDLKAKKERKNEEEKKKPVFLCDWPGGSL